MCTSFMNLPGLIPIVLILLNTVPTSLELLCHESFQSYEAGHITPTGYLNVTGLDLAVDVNYYEIHNFTHYRICPCSVVGCLRKCCKIGEAFDAGGTCVRHNLQNFTFSMDVHNLTYDKIHNDIENNFRLVHGETCLNGAFPLSPETHFDERYYLMENGHLHIPDRISLDKVLTFEDFCVEDILSSNNTVEQKIVVVCHRVVYEEPKLQILMAISIPFLIATLAVYCYLPDLRNLHGKSLMCHVAALTIGYTFLAIIRFSGKEPNPTLCVFSGYIIQFSFLAAFFWLNVMCFDIWGTFRAYRRRFHGNKNTKTFFLYCFYAWGCAFAISIVTLILQLTPNLPNSVVRPDLGVGICWFPTKAAVLCFFYGPIAFLLLCNLIFFAITATKIYFGKRRRRNMLNNEDSALTSRSSRGNRHRYFLYLKLFLVMGVNWCLEVISWGVQGPQGLWLLPDIFNSLQGFFIFLICVCQKRICRQLRAKWKSIPVNFSTRTTSINARSSSSSRSSFITLLVPSRKSSLGRKNQPHTPTILE